MIKQVKRFVAFTLALIMVLSLTAVAFATESTDSGIPENATRHEVSLTLLPEGYEGDELDAGSVSPYVWGNPSMNLIDHHVADTAAFYITDKYFAYEMEAIPVSGVPTTQGYSVALRMLNSGTLASMTGNADGGNYKLDWITIDTDANYYFRVTNATDFILSVNIIYYTWN